MSVKEPTEIKGIMPSYIGFLMGRIIEIHKSWDENDPELALWRCCRLVYFLPDALKKKLKKELQTITKELNQAYRVTSVDWYNTQLVRNREARRIATVRLPNFVDEIMSLLDAREYLELHKRKVPGGRELNY